MSQQITQYYQVKATCFVRWIYQSEFVISHLRVGGKKRGIAPFALDFQHRILLFLLFLSTPTPI